MHSHQGNILFNKGKLGQNILFVTERQTGNSTDGLKNCNKEDEIERKQDKWKKRV